MRKRTHAVHTAAPPPEPPPPLDPVQQAFHAIMTSLTDDDSLVTACDMLRLTENLEDAHAAPAWNETTTHQEATAAVRRAEAEAAAAAEESGVKPETDEDLRRAILAQPTKRTVPATFFGETIKKLEEDNRATLNAMIQRVLSCREGECGETDVCWGIFENGAGIPARLREAVELQNKRYNLNLVIESCGVAVRVSKTEVAWLDGALKVSVFDRT